MREFPVVAGMLVVAGIALSLSFQSGFPLIWGFATILLTRLDIAGMAFALKADSAARLKAAELRLILTGICLVCVFVAMPTYLLFSFEYSSVMAAMALIAAGATRSASMFAVSRRVGVSYFTPYLVVPSVALCWDITVISNRNLGGHILGIIAIFCCLSYIWKSWATRHSAETELDQALAKAESRRDEASRNATVSRMLFQHTTLRAALFDHDGKFMAVNKAWLGAILQSEEELLGKTISEAMPLAKTEWAQAIAAAQAGETTTVDGDPTVRADGMHVVLNWQVQPWFNDAGGIGGAVGYAQDVTEIFAAREAAKAKQDRLELALKATGAFIWEVDYAAKTILSDENATAFFGKELTFDMVSKQEHSMVHPEDRATNLAQANRVAKNGGYGRLEARNLMPDGSIRWVRSDLAPTKFSNGVATAFVMMTTDITEEMARQERLASMMERANIALAEKRKLLEELCGETSLKTAISGAVDEEKSTLCASESEESTFTQLFTGFEQILTEIDDRDVALSAAVQQLRSARANAEAANLAKSQFLANMSHELRTPLNAIIGYTEILIEDAEYEGREDAAKDANKVRTSATHLLKLINEILDLSKIEAGKMDITREATPLADVLTDIINSGESLAAMNNNRIQIELDCDRTLALTDGFRLRQCLLNLVSNACKFTENGTITIGLNLTETDENHRWFDISVQDTGIGISAAGMEHLFRPFSQADGSTTRKYGGTGLGLALTREMITLLDGDVLVESEVGVGSKFTIRIPAIGLEANDVEMTLAADKTSALVLVVDDDPVARALTARSASALGMSIASAETGRAALAFCDENDVGLIVLDLQLPDMDGLDVLAALRGNQKTRNTPVMVVSVDDDRRRSISAGAQEHLAKPCPSAVLTAAMARLARRHDDNAKNKDLSTKKTKETEADDQMTLGSKTQRSA